MKISTDYINGIVDTTKDFYEDQMQRINPDKDLQIFYDEIKDSKNKLITVGIKVTFTWIVEQSRNEDDNVRDDNHINIYSKDRLESVISDISSILNDIDAVVLD